jgi:ribosomal protein S18 acetylase RimI-like enzyme
MYTLREIGPDDLSLLLAVEEGLFDNPLIPEEARAFLADPANLLILAFDGHIAVGMLTATFLRHPDKPLSLFINELGTRDAWQRRGIATQMMRRAIDIARARGARGVWLGTEAENTEAKGLYRSLGAAELDGVFFGWDGAFDEDTALEDDHDAQTGDLPR